MGQKKFDKLLSCVKGVIKVKFITLESFIFRLHTKFTAALLLVFSILVTARQYIGDPIDCIAPKNKFPKKILDTYCWIDGTFSLADEWYKKVGEEVPYPGVAKSINKSEKTYHKYYQWVCFVLFLQSVLFFAPKYYWRTCEKSRIKSILLDLDKPLMTEDNRRQRIKLLVYYLKTNLNNHQIFALNYYLSEMYLLINVIFQMFFMDVFLGGEFTSYGLRVLQFNDWDPSVRFDPMIKVFPRLAKCNFHTYGPSGDVQLYDAICILPINIINEKIYIIIWFWFYFLEIVTTLLLIYRMLTLVFPFLRFYLLKYRANRCKPEHLQSILSKCSIGDWFVLTLLQKNMDAINFSQTVALLAASLKSDFQDINEKINIVEDNIFSAINA